jgi:transposase
MGEHRRKADGRRVFTTEFKRATVQRIVAGEKTVAELSRELDIAPSVIRNWKRFADAGATTAVQASEDVVPASQLREAYAKIRELERALGRKTMEVEILRATQEVVKKRRRCAESPDDDHAVDDRDLRGPRDRPAVRVLRGPAASCWPLSAGGRRDGPAADSGGDEQPRDVRLSTGLGDREPDLSDRLQPEADSARHATARLDAGTPGPHANRR